MLLSRTRRKRRHATTLQGLSQGFGTLTVFTRKGDSNIIVLISFHKIDLSDFSLLSLKTA
jgi:hypothetical protein